MSVQGGQLAAVTGVTPARVAAAEICADMRAGEMLDATFERRTGDLDARDRRWLRELVYGMLRQRSAIDAILAERVRGGIAKDRLGSSRPVSSWSLSAASHGKRSRVRGDSADGGAGESQARHWREQAGQRGAASRGSRERRSVAGIALRSGRGARRQALAPGMACSPLAVAVGRAANRGAAREKQRRGSGGAAAVRYGAGAAGGDARGGGRSRRRRAAGARQHPGLGRNHAQRAGRFPPGTVLHPGSRDQRWSRSTRRSPRAPSSPISVLRQGAKRWSCRARRASSLRRIARPLVSLACWRISNGSRRPTCT